MLMMPLVILTMTDDSDREYMEELHRFYCKEHCNRLLPQAAGV
ncbi:MAG: hypothetical protein RR946_03835 [Clostridia bacterium]